MRTQADREFDWSTGRELERKDTEIDRLRRDCAELYQVIGTMAEHCPDPDSPAIVKALDNASDAANGDPRRHNDLLPFVLPKPRRACT